MLLYKACNYGRLNRLQHAFSASRHLQRRMLATKDVKILYGSQTGTGQLFATKLSKKLKKKNVPALVQNLGEYDETKTTNENHVVLVVSCFGEGEPTHTTLKFWNWLMSAEREAEKVRFQKINYSVFGLGNSEYGCTRYQKVGKDIDKRLQELGANRIGELGMGDSHGEIEDDWDLWERKFMEVIETAQADVAPKQEATPAAAPEESVEKIVFHRDPNAVPLSKCYTDLSLVSSPIPFMLKVIEVYPLCKPDAMIDNYHIELSIKDLGHTYEVGDYIGIHPENDPALVEEIGQLLNLELDVPFTIQDPELLAIFPPYIQMPITMRQVLRFYKDIMGPPKRILIESLIEHVTDPVDKDRLIHSSAPADQRKCGCKDYCQALIYRNFGEIVKRFPSLKLGILDLLEVLPPLGFRYYSISSSPLVLPHRVDLTVGLHKFGPRKEKFGLCSKMLCELRVGSSVMAHIHKSSFKLPQDGRPIIMVGAGSGLAPFRGFIQSRIAENKPENILFFGCYNKDKDFIYEDELKDWENQGNLKVFTAFSHDQSELVFVQDIMRRNSALVWEWLENGASIYVCGSVGMGRGVTQAIHDIALHEGKLDEEGSKEFVENLQNSYRYFSDLFA